MAFVVSAVTTAISIGTVAAVATAVAEVGLALTVVGTVTKSKELVSIGKVMSVAGGITSIASNLANIGTSAASEGVLGSAIQSADIAGPGALEMASNAALTNQAAEAGTTALANEIAGTGIAELAPNLAQNASYGIEGLSGLPDATGMAGEALTSNVADQTVNQAIGGFTAPTPVTGEQAIQAASTPQFSTNVEAATNAASGAQGLPQGNPVPEGIGADSIKPPGSMVETKSWWDKQSPAVKSALIQGGLGAVGGLSQAWSAEQRLALEQKIAEERIKESQSQRANASAVPTIRFQPVGLVNRAIGG